MSSFDKLGLFEKSKVIEVIHLYFNYLTQKAKELGDKKRVLKQALKDKIQLDGEYELQNSKFAQKLDNGQYLCICCK